MVILHGPVILLLQLTRPNGMSRISQQFWGGGGQWARGRFVEASLCDDASTLGGSIEAGVEGATGERRWSQERVGSRVQRIRDYRYPAEGSLADRVGTFWRPVMRTVIGRSRLGRCSHPFLDACLRLATPRSSSALLLSAPCGRMGAAADTALEMGTWPSRRAGRWGVRRRRLVELGVGGTRWFRLLRQALDLPGTPLSLSLRGTSPTVASVEAACVACRSCSADVGGVRRLMFRQLELAQRARAARLRRMEAVAGGRGTGNGHDLTATGRLWTIWRGVDCHSGGTGEEGGLVGLEVRQNSRPGLGSRQSGDALCWPARRARAGGPGLGVCWGEGQLIDPPWIVFCWSSRNSTAMQRRAPGAEACSMTPKLRLPVPGCDCQF
ncbi:hypothetical protein B0T18DRAFT_414913 [Schizothecium vesticola]|uniref:Uncharacterized protein n=1 Tax=Schizothecium vesticola TaxID=314040 RepID=A0AA40K278_9PEZI|nr:hypothetical protein B0T18DRAFT_414913 [Schizothecium vesticola]